MHYKRLITGMLLLAATGVQADGIYLNSKDGTLGTGYEFKYPFGDSFRGRIGFSALTYGRQLGRNEMTYNASVDTRRISLIADWYPGKSTFRISAGLLYNGSDIALDPHKVGGSYIFNGVNYNATDVSSVNGSLGYRSTAPYLGIGWGSFNKKSGWGFAADFGLLYQGIPKVTLSAACGASLTASQCTTLQYNAGAESGSLRNDLEDSTWYPVLSVGARFRF